MGLLHNTYRCPWQIQDFAIGAAQGCTKGKKWWVHALCEKQESKKLKGGPLCPVDLPMGVPVKNNKLFLKVIFAEL